MYIIFRKGEVYVYEVNHLNTLDKNKLRYHLKYKF